MLALAREFNAKLNFVDFSANKALAFIYSAQAPMSEQFLILLMSDNEPVGFLAGLLFSPPFSDTLLAAEVGFYIRKEHRGTRKAVEMLKAFEDWAAAKGARFSSLVSQGASDVDPSDFYIKLGYAPIEETFVKRLR